MVEGETSERGAQDGRTFVDVKVKKKRKGKHAASVTVTRLASHARRILASVRYVLRTHHTDSGLRPICHSEDERYAGHLFITVLAYHTAHLVRVKLKEDGIHKSMDTIRTNLNRIKRITS